MQEKEFFGLLFLTMFTFFGSFVFSFLNCLNFVYYPFVLPPLNKILLL